MTAGTVYWVTGLAGSGKTTIGKLLSERLRQHKKPCVFLDGDDMRQVFGETTGHTASARLELAKKYARLCKLLSDQGLDVVCSTISMFHEVRDWNRAHIGHYKEIYLRVSKEILIQRDKLQLYSKALKGEASNVLGMDLEFEAPSKPDVAVDNGSLAPGQVLEEIWTQLESVRK